jgi:hypothetical protein
MGGWLWLGRFSQTINSIHADLVFVSASGKTRRLRYRNVCVMNTSV